MKRRRLLAIALVLLAVALIAAQSTPEPTPTQPRSDGSLVLGADVYVRSGPGREYGPVGSLVEGDEVDALSRNTTGDWVLIRYHDGFGWVRRDLAHWVENIDALPILDVPNLTPSPVPGRATAIPFFPTETPVGNWVRAITAESAYVRAGPGRTYLRLGQFYDGDLVEPVGRNEDTSWIMIRFGDDFGWIARNLVRWQDDLESLPVLTEDNLTPSATFTITDTPTRTPTPTDTATATDTATSTDIPTLTPSVTNTETSTATHTAIPTDTPTSTPSATPTAIPTLVPTAVPTETAVVTHTPVPVTDAPPSETPLPSATAAPSVTPKPATVEIAAVSTNTPEPLTASPMPTETDTPVPTTLPSVTSTSTVTPAPIETDTDTPVPASETTMIQPTSHTLEPTTETPVAGVAGATSAPTIQVTQVSVPPTDRNGAGLPIEAVVGGFALVAVLAYAGLYWRGLAEAERYAKGFVNDRCPVCQRGELVVEARDERAFGIPRIRRTVRCTACRSVLRETGSRRWRYAVDPLENSALYGQYNGREIDDDTLKMLASQAATPSSPPARRPPSTPPAFVDDEDA